MPSLVFPEPPVPIPGVPPDVLCGVVVGSQWIFDCTSAAAAMATQRRCTVAFMFIDGVVVVRPDDDATEVARTWWLKQYGESPEQTMARR